MIGMHFGKGKPIIRGYVGKINRTKIQDAVLKFRASKFLYINT